MKTIAIIGFGSRGQMFADLLKNETEAGLVAVAEVVEAGRLLAHEKFGIPSDMCFNSADEFLSKGKICDAVFICTQDADHYDMTIKALKLGYDICLEKPAAATIGQCINIRDETNRLGRKVMLTHVLRYAPFYRNIKQLIADGILGEIVDIDQTENVAYWHFALSYVRGPWRNMGKSTPTIIAKCCHDLDIIRWLMDKSCKRISSFGKLFYFNSEHAPKGSAEYCVDCDKKVRENCLYNAYKIYPERIKNPVVGGTARFKGKDIYKILDNKEDVICKCVFHADNDAVDNQIVNMEFSDGSTAHLTMTAFSADCHRNIKIHGTEGEIYGDIDDAVLTLNVYGKSKRIIDVNKSDFNEDNVGLSGGHGGGDYYLLKDFIDYITKNSKSLTRTTIDDSIESHIMGFKAEESRLSCGKVLEI